MKKNNNKKKARQRYITPKIVDTFSEQELLKKVHAYQSADNWSDNIDWKDIGPGPWTWQVQSK